MRTVSLRLYNAAYILVYTMDDKPQNLRAVSVHLMTESSGTAGALESGVHALATRWAAAQLDAARALCRAVVRSVAPPPYHVRGFPFVYDVWCFDWCFDIAFGFRYFFFVYDFFSLVMRFVFASFFWRLPLIFLPVWLFSFFFSWYIFCC